MTLTQLRELCERATPGPWKFKEGDNQITSPKRAVALAAGNFNAAFIAAANPQAVLQLIERVEILTDALKDCIEGFEGTYGEKFWESPLGKNLGPVLPKYGAEVELK